MSMGLARALVLVSGAAILIIETLAARLVAPYVGLTLESHTAAIGVALLGIAAGAHVGGRLADRLPPRRVIVGGLTAGGLLVLAVRPIIHLIGPNVSAGPASTVQLVVVSTLAPVTALAMVPPAVVKARLSNLAESGSVVGTLSALGTIGALAGTFLTGFVFVATLPTTMILLVTAIGCLLLALFAVRDQPRGLLSVGLVAVALGPGLLLVDGPCDVETAYYCARIETDPVRASGRILYLDDLRHSYVDLTDPGHLEFTYIQRFADAVDAHFPAGRPLDAVHVGGGGFTMPRWLAATRPGSRSVVLEIDRSVVSLGRAHLGVDEIAGLEVITGDARTSLRRLGDSTADLIVGDAFGSVSVPWHLATREFVADVRRVLRPHGLFILNVIDNDPRAFLRAELATVAAVFDHVALLARSDQLGAGGGGNFVIVASDRRLDHAELSVRARARGEPGSLVRGGALIALADEAMILEDDRAPVDQLLTPYRGPAR